VVTDVVGVVLGDNTVFGVVGRSIVTPRTAVGTWLSVVGRIERRLIGLTGLTHRDLGVTRFPCDPYVDVKYVAVEIVDETRATAFDLEDDTKVAVLDGRRRGIYDRSVSIRTAHIGPFVSSGKKVPRRVTA
jgi:hypothetical protein